MELKEQIIQEYLNTGCGYRKLQAKYGISRTTISQSAQNPARFQQRFQIQKNLQSAIQNLKYLLTFAVPK
jgi:Trp operon repressor